MAPPQMHDAVEIAIQAIDEAQTVWQAELVASELIGRDWLPLPVGRAVLLEVNLRQAADEAATFGGQGRTLQALLHHLADSDTTQIRVNMASRALGVLQPWVPLLDAVELIEAREDAGHLDMHFGYRLNGHLVDEHHIVITHEDGIIQCIDVGPDGLDAEPVDPRDFTPRLATLMVHTTRYFRKLRDPEAVNPAWALLTSRVRGCLPPVLTLVPVTDERAKSLMNQFGRLKATKLLAGDNDLDLWWLRMQAETAIEYERVHCPGGWTVDDVHAYFKHRVRQVDPDEEELLEKFLILYIDWRMGKRGYADVAEAAREALYTFRPYF